MSEESPVSRREGGGCKSDDVGDVEVGPCVGGDVEVEEWGVEGVRVEVPDSKPPQHGSFYIRSDMHIASFPGLPRFRSSVCVQYNTVFRALLLPCIILNTNRRTKMGEAWERG